MNQDQKQGNVERSLRWFGAIGLGAVTAFGAATIFFVRSVAMIFRRGQAGNILQQVYFIGARTMGIVILVAMFTGMVLGLQLYYTLVKFGSQGAL